MENNSNTKPLSACSKPLLPAVLSLFDGMSCGQIALNKIGYKYGDYYASEIDKYAIQVTQKNYPDTKQIGCVTNVKGISNIELLYGGSPCQSFSIAGDNTGFEGKSGLFYEYVRVLNEVKPKYFLLENVKMKKEWQDVITKELGVEPIEINSNLLSAQNRKRLYWTNIPNVTIPKDKGILLENVITDGIPLKEKAQTILSTIYKENAKSMIKRKKWGLLVCENGVERKFTPKECEILQTVPDNYTSSVSDTQRYRMLGNGWTVDVIAHILSFIPQS